MANDNRVIIPYSLLLEVLERLVDFEITTDILSESQHAFLERTIDRDIITHWTFHNVLQKLTLNSFIATRCLRILGTILMYIW